MKSNIITLCSCCIEEKVHWLNPPCSAQCDCRGPRGLDSRPLGPFTTAAKTQSGHHVTIITSGAPLITPTVDLNHDKQSNH